LGWADVEVIDEDLGRSGAGARRPGFEKLLAAICEGRVGAVLLLEASPVTMIMLSNQRGTMCGLKSLDRSMSVPDSVM
jgi:hypothetical protein